MLELLVSVLQFVVVMLVPVSFLKLVLLEPVLHQMVVMLVPVSFQKHHNHLVQHRYRVHKLQE